MIIIKDYNIHAFMMGCRALDTLISTNSVAVVILPVWWLRTANVSMPVVGLVAVATEGWETGSGCGCCVLSPSIDVDWRT